MYKKTEDAQKDSCGDGLVVPFNICDGKASLSLICVNRDRVVNYTLGRRLPTDHVSGQLQFRFEITSIHPGLQHVY